MLLLILLHIKLIGIIGWGIVFMYYLLSIKLKYFI